MAAASRAAIRQAKENGALLPQELVPKEVGAAPAVSNDLSVRPPIRVNQNGIFRLRMEVRRLDDAGVELHSVARFHGEKFHGREMVVRKLGDFVFVNSSEARSIGAVEVLPGRGRGVRISVVESGSIGCKTRGVRALVLGEPGEAGSVEGEAVEVAFQRRFFRGGEVDKALRFIYRIDRRDFPLTLGELRKLFALEVIEIQVAIPAALARPQEALAIAEEIKVVAEVDPIGVIFAENGAGLASGAVGDQQIKRGLCAMEALNGEMFGVREPVHARNVDIGFRSSFHHARFATA